jgi:acetoin:2,6-dichlorophenolindophenol oxidoreductase subunit beta
MREIGYLDAIREAQVEEMERDADVLMMGQDLRAGLYGSAKLVELFGEDRILDLPTSETACVGAAAGAAMTGLRPLIDMTAASFCFVAIDQFISTVSKARYATGGRMKVPVTYRVSLMFDGAVGVQHSDRPHPMFMQMPGLKLVSPSSPADAKGLLKSSIRDDDPVVFLEDTYYWDTKGPVPEETESALELGTAAVRRGGADVTVVGLGRMVAFALAAAEELAGEGISVEVVDLRSLVPIDWETILASVAKTGRLVAADPAMRTCSAASEIAATVAEELGAPVRRVTSPVVHTPFSPALEKGMYPDAGSIAAAVRTILET